LQREAGSLFRSIHALGTVGAVVFAGVVVVTAGSTRHEIQNNTGGPALDIRQGFDGPRSRLLRRAERSQHQANDIGVRGETPGILPAASQWTNLVKDRIAFGQSVSVNAVQMAAAINTVANDGVRVDPSLIMGRATTDDGKVVGTDTTRTRRVNIEARAMSKI